jgi:hypothetical protein
MKMTLEQVQVWFDELLERLPTIKVHQVATGGIAVGGTDVHTGQPWNSGTTFYESRFDEVEARAWAVDAGAALSTAFPHADDSTRQEWNRIMKESGSSIYSHFDALVGIFRGAASRVKAGRIPLQSASSPPIGRAIPYKVLADVILRGLHNAGEVTSIWEIAQEAGVQDFGKVTQVSEELVREGLVVQFASFSEDLFGRISPKGARLIEDISKDVNAMEHFTKIDNKGSLTIHGNVIDTNLAFVSPGANQNNGRGGQHSSILDMMVVTIKEDATLSKDQRQDALADVATLKLQLDKTAPNKSLVRSLLDNLGTIASVAGLASEVIKAYFKS